MRPRILVAESRGFAAEAAAILETAGSLELADLDRAGLREAVVDADVVWVRLRHVIDADLLDRGRRLRILATPTTATDHVDEGGARARGVQVISLKGDAEDLRDVRATAELTVALLISLVRGLPDAVTHVRRGGWDRDLFRGRELYGKTAGVVGYGRLGRMVGRSLQVFGMRVLAADPRVGPGSAGPGVTLTSLHALLDEAEVVTLHASYDDSTHGLLGRAELERMRPGAWLVNTARGQLVDEAALVRALESGRLAGAAIDVLAGESSEGMAGHPLVAYARAHSNLLITPHIGGCTVESMAKTEVHLARKVVAALGTATG